MPRFQVLDTHNQFPCRLTARMRWKAHSVHVGIILPSHYTWLLIFTGVNDSSIDCHSIVVSLEGQIPPMATVKQHAERATSDEVPSQQQGTCSCQSPPQNKETTSPEGTQSQTSISTESTVSVTQIATSSFEPPDKNTSTSASISQAMLSNHIIRETDYLAGGVCHCASGSTRVFESAECTLVHWNKGSNTALVKLQTKWLDPHFIMWYRILDVARSANWKYHAMYWM